MIKPTTAYPLDVEATRSIINSSIPSAAPSTRRPSIPQITTSNFPSSNSNSLKLNTNNLSSIPFSSNPMSAGGSGASALPSPGGTSAGGSRSDLFDDETVLSNVEEMLEGFEWRGSTTSSSSGGRAGMSGGRANGKADEIEKSLVGELKALEAVSFFVLFLVHTSRAN